jgi:hypothetical protein
MKPRDWGALCGRWRALRQAASPVKFPPRGGLDLIGKAAVLKTAGRKPLGVRVPRPPFLVARPFIRQAFGVALLAGP